MLHDQFRWNRARIDCIVYLMIGMIQIRTVNFAKIASTFPGNTQTSSHYKRLQRLFCQFSFDLNQVARFIAHLVPLLQFKLTLDRTNWKWGNSNINDLVLGIVYCGSALPLLWVTLNKKGNSNTQERIELMKRFLTIFGAQAITCLLADREFIGVEWFRYLIENHIKLVIRIKKIPKFPIPEGFSFLSKTSFGVCRVAALLCCRGNEPFGGTLLM